MWASSISTPSDPDNSLKLRSHQKQFLNISTDGLEGELIAVIPLEANLR